MRSRGIFAALLIAGALTAAPGSASAAPAVTTPAVTVSKTCGAGYKHAVIGGQQKCLPAESSARAPPGGSTPVTASTASRDAFDDRPTRSRRRDRGRIAGRYRHSRGGTDSHAHCAIRRCVDYPAGRRQRALRLQAHVLDQRPDPAPARYDSLCRSRHPAHARPRRHTRVRVQRRHVLAPARRRYPTTFTGTAALAQWTLTPGTYYWQAYYYGVLPSGLAGTFTTPVYTVNVDKPPLSLTLSQAKGDVPIAIKDQTHRTPYRLSRKCERRSQASFTCQVGWTTTNRLLPSTVIYAGTMTVSDAGLGDDGNSYFNYRFRGIRVGYRCARRHSIKACARSVRW